MELFDDFLMDNDPFDHDSDFLAMDEGRVLRQHHGLWNGAGSESLLGSILNEDDGIGHDTQTDMDASNLLCPFDGPAHLFGGFGDNDVDADLLKSNKDYDSYDVGLSEDDGCSEDSGFDPLQQMVSPASVHNSDGEQHEAPTERDIPTLSVVKPNTNSNTNTANSITVFPLSNQRVVPKIYRTIIKSGGKTALLLPVLSMKHPSENSVATVIKTTKKRRISNSSSDSGNSSLDMNNRYADSLVSPVISPSSPKALRLTKPVGKYPALVLTDEERRICERENVKLPTHYPLTREEEKNLKRIRRKIRNKVSAQDSRRRKREYMDDMEKRVKLCSEEKDELAKQIEQLETQNKSLAGQLRRLHQFILNGGMKQNQTSTAMMVLLLSTAFFLLPGFKDQHENSQDVAPQVDIARSIKMPPMPGQSRSLLQIKQEFEDSPAVETPLLQTKDRRNIKVNSSILISNKIVKEEGVRPTTPKPFPTDHDYTGGRRKEDGLSLAKKRSYIVDDVPPEGYGFTNYNLSNDTRETHDMSDGEVIEEEEVYFNTHEEVVISEIGDKSFIHGVYEEDRKLNVNVATSGGSGIRTVILHVPKDII